MVSYRDCITLGFITQILTLSTLLRTQKNIPGINHHDNRGAECPICLKNIYKKTRIQQITGCGHIYHPLCLKKWIHEINLLECPLCRFRPELCQDPFIWDSRQVLDNDPPLFPPPSRISVIYHFLTSKRFVLSCIILCSYVSCLFIICDLILQRPIQNVLCGKHIYLLLHQGQCPLRNETNEKCSISFSFN